jgi:hypothetical protein
LNPWKDGAKPWPEKKMNGSVGITLHGHQCFVAICSNSDNHKESPEHNQKYMIELPSQNRLRYPSGIEGKHQPRAKSYQMKRERFLLRNTITWLLVFSLEI